MMVKYMRLPTIFQNLVGSHTFPESGRSFTVLLRGDSLTIGHPELEEHTQHVIPLGVQIGGGTDHFYPEEVMKVPQILHVK